MLNRVVTAASLLWWRVRVWAGRRQVMPYRAAKFASTRPWALRAIGRATMRRLPAKPPHPARAHIHAHETAGERVADAVVAGMGSWRFIIIQTVIVACWVVANVIGWRLRWDVYPFILLNLMFSTQAAYASPLILMAANRTASKDRKRDDVEAQEVEQLTAMNRQQLDILHELQAMRGDLSVVRGSVARTDEHTMHGLVALLGRVEAVEQRVGMAPPPEIVPGAAEVAPVTPAPAKRSHKRKAATA